MNPEHPNRTNISLPPNEQIPQDVRPPGQGMHRLSKVGKRYFNLIEFDPEEELLHEIRKHAFGLFSIFATGGLIAITVLGAAIFLAVSGALDQYGDGSINAGVAFIGFLLAVLVMIFTAINASIYRHNVVYVTNEKIAQILHLTLFNKKISQLSIGDVQDVSVHQNGFLPTLLGYGTIVIETAGEQQNYTFTYIPDPYKSSKVIIGAHEENMKKYGN